MVSYYLYGSIVVNILFLVGFLLPDVRDGFKRFINRWRYKGKSDYVNTLFITKNGSMDEKFEKLKYNGGIEINDNTYIRNPRRLINYKGIPTYIHLEDVPGPISPFEKWGGDGMTSAEMDQVIMNSNSYDFIRLVKKYAPIAGIIVGLLFVAIGVMAYFNWQIFDVVVQQGIDPEVVVEQAENVSNSGVSPRG